jgi:hypothetical protein
MLERGASKDEILLTLHEWADRSGITAEDDTVRLSQCHNQRINCRSPPWSMAELGGSTSKGHRQCILDRAARRPRWRHVIAVIKHALAGQSPRGATQADCPQAPQFDKACPVPRT